MALAEDIDLPAIFQTISSNPEVLEVVKQLNETICFGNSALSRMQEEAIATVVAMANQCSYGALTHGGFFRRHSGDPELASHLLDDYSRADLDPRNRRMLDFAVRLTREPGSFTDRDLEGLREVGFDQEAIVSIVLITCLFNFMNRLATSFGVEVPPSYRKVVGSWLSGPAAQESWLFPPVEFQSDESPAARSWLDVPRSQQKPAGQSRLRQDQQDTGQDPSHAQQFGLEARPLTVDQHETGEGPSREVQRDDQQGPSHEGQQDTGTDPFQAEEGDDGELENQGTQEASQSLERFISECCTVASSESTTARDLYISYLRWCDDNGEHALLQRNFGMQLTQLEYRRRRRSGGRHWWQGIGLKGQEN